jgi:hypothetical protein
MSKRGHHEVSATDDMPLDQICEVVLAIRKLTGPARVRKIEAQKTYADFERRYPMLFATACADDFDMDRFVYMMQMKMRIDQRELTAEQASIEVGQTMFDRFVAPNLPPEPKN